MTDTTNHADVIRDTLGMLDPCHRRAYSEARTALDALTRELEDAKEDARLWHESEKACSAQFDKLLDENRAQSARIATLEEALDEATDLLAVVGCEPLDKFRALVAVKGVQG